MKVTISSVGGATFETAMPGDRELDVFRKACTESLRRVGDKWKSESVQNAPRGPTAEMLKKLHKSGGAYTIKAKGTKPAQAIKLTDFYRMSAAALAKKKKGTLSGPASGLKGRLSGANWKNPGGLEDSIQFESNEEKAEVYVASNAAAGEYAHIIHDLKGQKWHERGPGTQAKGEQADDKFIERAQPAAMERLKGLMEKALGKLFGHKG